MSKKSWIVIGIIIALIAGAVVYIAMTPRAEPEVPADTPLGENTDNANVPADVPAPSAGAYVAYSQDVVSAAKGEKIIFFHAPWCPQCRDLDKSIAAGPIPNNVTIFKIDYDSNQALRKKYGVTMQTTFVKIDDQGNKINSYVAYDHPNLDAVVQNLTDIR